MGVAPYILRRCPVVIMTKKRYSRELAELVLTLMTSELGAGQIATYVAKKRAAFWVSQARVYLESHVSNKEDFSSLKAFGFVQSSSSSPFPSLTSHCGGFGGSRGPSQRQIQRFFLAASSHPANFGDRFMKSIGGEVNKNHLLSIVMISFDRPHKFVTFRFFPQTMRSTFLLELRITILGTILICQLKVCTLVSTTVKLTLSYFSFSLSILTLPY
jgi:hypothetical protein